MGLKTVSVIVPSYNYGAVLTGCVQSVLRQPGVDVRVLVIDDCSTDDDTHVVGQRLAAADGRVEFRRHECNRGLIATANEGLAWADGDYVVLLSADDELAPGALHRAAQVLERSPEIGMVYGRAPYWHTGKPVPNAKGRWHGTTVWSGVEWIGTRCRSGYNCISSPEVVVRNSVQQAAGGYEPECPHMSDLNMWLRIAAVSDIAYIRGVPQAFYRIHADSMFRSAMTPLLELTERRRAFDAFFARSGDLFEGATDLRRIVGRTLARQALWRASRAIDRNLVTGAEALPWEELVAFAVDVCPDARNLREWHGLQLRRRIGAGRSRWFPPFLATGAAHRLRLHIGRARWIRTGV
jgi:glycosyltransferase involved in cell wall biosynthesis